MPTKAQQAELLTEAEAQLRAVLRSGDTIYTVLRHVSRSGMMRHISLFVIRDNQPVCLDWQTAQLLGWQLAKGDGIKVGGCGMDMGFHLVYSLSAALFGYGTRGAYDLNQRWL